MHFSSVPYKLCAMNAEVYNSRTGGCVSEWPCPKVCDTVSALQWGVLCLLVLNIILVL